MITQTLLNEMDLYIELLKQLRIENPLKAKELAKKSLIESGILNPDGSTKKYIIDFYE